MAETVVVIVSYGSASTIGNCLRALDLSTYRDFTVLLVDNCPDDGSAEIVRSIAESCSFRLELLEPCQNLGFAGGNNYAYKRISEDTRYVALLNPDVFVSPQWLERLIGAMGEHPEVGICASLILDEQTGRIDAAGDFFSIFLKGFKRGEGQPADAFPEGEYVFGACAGAALYRRLMVDEIGLFDEDFFLIQEDTDLNVRAQLAGWRTFYVPAAVAHHRVRTSIGVMSDTAVYFSLKNCELLRMKSLPAGVLICCLPALLAFELVEFFYFSIRHRRIGIYLRAKADALLLLPAMLTKRRRVIATQRIPAAEFLQRMTFVPSWDVIAAKVNRLIHG